MRFAYAGSCLALLCAITACSPSHPAPGSGASPKGSGSAGAVQVKNGLYESPGASQRGDRGSVVATRDDGVSARLGGAHKHTILYRSATATGYDVTVSGALLVPAGTAPEGGWPLVSWAHGTTGIASRCAPSLTENFGYDQYADELAMLVRAGYAVAATDYAGLGLAGRHLYENAAEEGNAVADIVVAARSAAPQISPKTWFALGHSQGGSAVVAAGWGTSSYASKPPSGVIALAPSADFANEANYLREGLLSSEEGPVYYAYDLISLHEIDPTVKLEDFFTGPGLERLTALRNNFCLWDSIVDHREAGLDLSSFTDRAFHDTGLASRLAAYGNPDRGFPVEPVLAISGAHDADVPKEMVGVLVNSLRSAGADIEEKTLPGDHIETLTGSRCEQLGFMAKHGGAPFAENCPS